MLVGSANAGKTTLLLQLTKKGRMVHQRAVQVGINGLPLSTVGVELGQWEYSPTRSLPVVTFMTWDFGGQVMAICDIGNARPYIFVSGIMAAKRHLAHIFFKFSNYFIFLSPLQLHSYALEISLSIMELQWPEFVITHTF